MEFKVGDNVKIVNYGHTVWYMEGESILMGDLRKDIIGQNGVISKTQNVQNVTTYCVNGIIGKTAWFNQNQLELI